MRCPSIASLLIACLIATQMPGASAQSLAGSTIAIPSGTLVPLTLVSQVKSKSTKVGDPVRAQVAFPVTIGSQLAIPAGTFVEGVVTSLTTRDKKTHRADVEIHFTRMLYANGYTVMLDGASGHASLSTPFVLPDGGAIEGDAPPMIPVASSEAAFAFEPQPEPQVAEPTPTLPHASSPSYGPAIALGLGGAVALILTAVIVSHRKQQDYVMFDAGWQLQMNLNTPIDVQSAKVQAAVASSSGS